MAQLFSRLTLAAALAVTTVLGAASASADVIGSWTNASLNVDGPIAATTGNGSLSRTGASRVNSASDFRSYGWPNALPALHADRDRYHQITVDTTGYQAIQMNWDQLRSGTSSVSPEFVRFSYSTDGGVNFTDHATIDVETSSTSADQNLTSISALNDNPNVVFRFYAYDQEGSQASTTYYYEQTNISVEGTLIPKTGFATWTNSNLNVVGPINSNQSNATLSRTNVTRVNSGSVFRSHGWPNAINTSRYHQIAVDTTGYKDIEVSWTHLRSSGSTDSPTTLQFAYSTNGGSDFTNFGGTFTIGTSATNALRDVTSIPGLNNNPDVVFRFYAYNAAGSAASTSFYFQQTNLVVSGWEIPSVTLSSTSGALLNSSYVVDAAFSDDVTGFDAGDVSFTAGTGTISGFSGSGDTYSFTVNPTSQGTVSIQVPASGSDWLVSNILSRDFDSVAPTVALTSGVAANTNAAFSVTANFSESVTGFVVGDVSATNASVGTFSGSGAGPYTFTVTPSGQGAVSVSVAAGVAADAATNTNTASNAINTTFDSVAPTVTLSSGVAANTNAAFSVSADFSESVTGFIAGDVSATNASISDFAGSGSAYTFTVNPSGQGAVSVSVAAGVAADGATNTNTASNTINTTFDSVAPTVALTSGVAANTNAAFSVSADFSESVSGFIAGDVSATNASISDFAGSGSAYTFTVNPSGQGAVSVSVAAGVAADGATNTNTASNTINTTFDSVAPTVALTSGVAANTNAAFSVSADFSENVTGFIAGDVSATNASISDFAGSGSAYTFTVNPSGQGAVSVSVAAGVAADAATNNNTASNTINTTFDSVAPTVALSSGVGADTNVAFSVSADFSENVTGFIAGDVSATNASISDFAGSGSAYTFTVNPSGQGAVSVSVAAGVAADAATNNNTASNTINTTFDSVAPTVALSSGVGADTNAAFSVSADFSESVTGFVAGDVSATNASISDFAGSGSAYTFTVTPSGQGAVSVSVAAGVAADAATNNNTASNTINTTFDSVAPTVALTSGVAANTNAAFSVSADFSENVSGFIAGDVSATNASISDFAGTGSAYTFTVNPSGQGAVSVSVAAGVAADAATNNNTASNTINTTFDSVAPTVALTSGVAAFTNAAFSVTATFSEDVTGFVAGDVSATNASVSDFAGSDDVYTFTITPTTDGAVGVSVAAGVAADIASNVNSVSNAISTTYDTTAPSMVLSVDAVLAVATAFTGTVTADDGSGSGVQKIEMYLRKRDLGLGVPTITTSPWSFEPTQGSGEYWIGVITTDNLGNAEHYVGDEVYVVYNETPNGALPILFSGPSQTSVFPMESGLNVEIGADDIEENGSITVSRLEGAVAPTGHNAGDFIDQAIVITPAAELVFGEATVVVEYDEALLGGFDESAITTAYRDNDGAVSSVSASVDTNANTITFTTDGFSTWYFGPAGASSVSDWSLLHD